MDYKFVPMLDFRQVRIIPAASTTVESRAKCDTSITLSGMNLTVPFIIPPMHSLYSDNLARNVAAVGAAAVVPRPKHGVFDLTHYGDNLILNSSMDQAMELAQAMTNFSDAKNKILSIEIANGHMRLLTDKVKEVKDKFPDIKVWAGTVITPEAVDNLINAGADVALIGIGVGSACTTTPMTGVGLPAFATVMLCAPAGPVILTGGLREPGDIAKAIGMGAEAVYIGALVKGASDTNSPTRYWGEASELEKENNSHIEGRIEALQPKTQTSADIIHALREHLQSAMSYSDAFTINEFRNKCQFAEVR